MKTITVHKFALYDCNDDVVMTTTVDEPDPRADIEFWDTFITECYALVYCGEDTELVEDDDEPEHDRNAHVHPIMREALKCLR